jgi:ribosomal protein S18 acetylase RimI-like enzyme
MTAVLEAGLVTSLDSGYMHPGDLQWRVFGPHGFPLSEIIELWEDNGAIVGFALLESQTTYSWQVLPEFRGSALDAEIARWAHNATLRWRRENSLLLTCSVEVFDDDGPRISLLESIGYRRTEYEFVAFKQTLRDIPTPVLPAGFAARALEDADIESRARCQFEAFAPGSRTTAATWRALMGSSPAYRRELDSVVAAPDGTIVAAAMCWLDERNRIGLFEPVATRPDYQRRGMGRALMLRGLRALGDHGMATAFVSTNATNTAARALYTSVGFKPRNHGYEMTWRPA